MPRGNDISRMRDRCQTAERRVLTTCGRALVDALVSAADRQFTKGMDVDGKRFIPPKDGHRPAMQRSGALRRSIHVSAQASLSLWRVRVSSATGYDQFLRDGTRYMQPRRFVPRPDEPMPAAWDIAARRAIETGMAKDSRR